MTGIVTAIRGVDLGRCILLIPGSPDPGDDRVRGPADMLEPALGGAGLAMAEGLNPIEAGKKLHEHGEAAEHDEDRA